jgi:palmitoyltransferase
LNSNALVNIIDIKSMTPLHWATFNGNGAIVTYLIVNGADIEMVDLRNRRTPLIWAARYGYDDIVDILIKAGANLHALDRSGWSAHRWATHKGHVAAAHLIEAAFLTEVNA